MIAGQVAEVAPATLEVRDLSVHFTSRAGVVRAVDNVSFLVGAGRIRACRRIRIWQECYGPSIMRLIDPPGRIVGGRILFTGATLAQLPEREMRALRGSRIAMVFQDPMMTPQSRHHRRGPHDGDRARPCQGWPRRGALAFHRGARDGRHSFAGRALPMPIHTSSRRHATEGGDCHRVPPPARADDHRR